MFQTSLSHNPDDHSWNLEWNTGWRHWIW